MKEAVSNYIRHCKIHFQAKPPMGNYKDPSSIWRVVATDIAGPLVMSKNKSRFILVAVDVMSKFVVIKSVTRSTADEMVKFLRDEECLKFAVPKRIISDNAVQYRAKIYKDFLKEFGIESYFTASYHPQANCTEAANKTMGTNIKSFIANDTSHHDWDVHLQEIADAMNNSKHTRTPSVVVFG